MDTLIYSVNSQYTQQLRQFLINAQLEGDVTVTGDLTVTGTLQSPPATTLTIIPGNGIISTGTNSIINISAVVTDQLLAFQSTLIFVDQGFLYGKSGQTYAGAPVAIYNFTVLDNNGAASWAIGSLSVPAGGSVLINITIPTYPIARRMFYQLEGTDLALGNMSIVSTGVTPATFTCRMYNSGAVYTNAQIVNLHFMTN